MGAVEELLGLQSHCRCCAQQATWANPAPWPRGLEKAGPCPGSYKPVAGQILSTHLVGAAAASGPRGPAALTQGWGSVQLCGPSTHCPPGWLRTQPPLGAMATQQAQTKDGRPAVGRVGSWAALQGSGWDGEGHLPDEVGGSILHSSRGTASGLHGCGRHCQLVRLLLGLGTVAEEEEGSG